MCNINKIKQVGKLGALFLAVLTLVVGCSPIEGQRYWWDDQSKEELPDDYMLPDSPPEYPVPTDPAPFVPKNLDTNEVQLATEEEKASIALGIPRSGVDNPLENRVIVPAEKYVDETIYDEGNPEEYLDEAEYGDGGEDATQFAEGEEKINGSQEGEEFIDELNATENYNNKGEQNVGGSGDTTLDEFKLEGVSDNPGTADEELVDEELNGIVDDFSDLNDINKY